MTLRYPQELNTADVDYVVFTPHQYQTNASGVSGGATGDPVILYMPTSTPVVSNTNNWGPKSFEGPLGALQKTVASEAVGMIDDIGAEGGGGRSIDSIKQMVGEGMQSGGGALKQAGVKAVAGMAQMEPNQLLALSRGRIYNPNIELLYKGPEVRGFNFSYTFVPKSAREAREVNKIIKHFKIHHSPGTDAGMYVVPDVFSVRYMYKGGPNTNFNEFKRAALTNITVQANPGLPMHMTFENGMPVVTQMSMSFTEVDVITRDDHKKSISQIGF